jgi:hypothetical protein
MTAACARCAHFQSSPVLIERRLRGLASLSSAYASVRAEDGLCARHDRYVAASSGCAQYRHSAQGTDSQGLSRSVC